MTIKLVVFDLAGTTVEDNDAVNRCLREAIADAGLDVSADRVNTVMGIPKPVAIRTLVEGTALAGRVDEIYTGFVARMTRFYAEDPAVVEIPGASRVFAILRRSDIKVALDTGFSRAITNTLLDRLGWRRAGLVDGSVCSDEVPQGRPHPDMIHRLMSEFGVMDPRTVVKVGDTPADLEEGTTAGCGRVIGVTQGSHTREQLARFRHTDLIETVADLPALLGLALPPE